MGFAGFVRFSSRLAYFALGWGSVQIPVLLWWVWRMARGLESDPRCMQPTKPQIQPTTPLKSGIVHLISSDSLVLASFYAFLGVVMGD